MQIPILIEPVAGNGYRARGGDPLALTAEGATAEEAIENLRHLLDRRLSGGTCLVPMEVTNGANPWAKMAGMFKDDPLFDDWQASIAEYRQKVEDDPEIP
jgi:hypothetical protein